MTTKRKPTPQLATTMTRKPSQKRTTTMRRPLLRMVTVQPRLRRRRRKGLFLRRRAWRRWRVVRMMTKLCVTKMVRSRVSCCQDYDR
jgi:hypothetical protein